MDNTENKTERKNMAMGTKIDLKLEMAAINICCPGAQVQSTGEELHLIQNIQYIRR